jgi:ribosomal protein S18 acetylase RimI-like enzyme
VGIYALAVRPEARRAGIATALVHAALLAARRRGARFAVAQAEPGGVAVGARLGLREVCRLEQHLLDG